MDGKYVVEDGETFLRLHFEDCDVECNQGQRQSHDSDSALHINVFIAGKEAKGVGFSKNGVCLGLQKTCLSGEVLFSYEI
eukprot:m.48938 g.48938  ORF g.48938 m.48938 type:complete len:80 (+) comp33944_c0_seq6:71-310(+)